MAYCIKCGKELHDGANFCANCGANVPSDTIALTTQAPDTTQDDSLTPNQNTNKTPEQIDPEEKKSTTKIIKLAIYISIACVFLGLILFAVIYAIGPRKSDAKQHAKKEVESAWKEFDKNLDLVYIDYDSVDVREWNKDEIDAYLAEKYNQKITDVNGKTYDSYQEYWESIGYDPHSETYRIFTVKGDYRVTDHKDQNYEGWYCVIVLHKVNQNTWSIQETELELPDELKQYLPN